MLNLQLPDSLVSWADSSLASGQNILATSNQGTVLLFQDGAMEFVVKTAMGGGAVLRARQATLEREHQAYERMEGLPGIPRCYGMVDERFLVLEYVRGTPYREAVISDREAWFAELLAILRSFHDLGVAHGDLKNKSNLIADEQGRPRVIDFGTTILRKAGFAPVNHRVFDFVCQLDINAWVKHKYQGRFDEVSAQDQPLFKDSWLERIARSWRQKRGAQGPR